MATKPTDETVIAVISNNMEYVKKDISEIKEGLKNLPGTYVTQKEHAEFVTAVNTRFIEVEATKSFFKYANPIITSLITSIFLLLFLSFLNKLK